MGKQFEEEEPEAEFTVTLDLDDGRKVECNILTILEADGKDYIALLPISDSEEGEVYLYRYTEEEGNPSLENIESDEEYEAVVDAFDEWMDSQEYDELVDADEVD